jgi:four helix bundle protein
MDKAELKKRAKEIGWRASKRVRHFPCDVPSDIVARRLTRSALSVGANDRSVCRSRSRAEFAEKLGLVWGEAGSRKRTS